MRSADTAANTFQTKVLQGDCLEELTCFIPIASGSRCLCRTIVGVLAPRLWGVFPRLLVGLGGRIALVLCSAWEVVKLSHIMHREQQTQSCAHYHCGCLRTGSHLAKVPDKYLQPTVREHCHVPAHRSRD